MPKAKKSPYCVPEQLAIRVHWNDAGHLVILQDHPYPEENSAVLIQPEYVHALILALQEAIS